MDWSVARWQLVGMRAGEEEVGAVCGGAGPGLTLQTSPLPQPAAAHTCAGFRAHLAICSDPAAQTALNIALGTATINNIKLLLLHYYYI